MPSLHNFRDAAESASMTPERLYRSAAPMGDVVDSDTVVHDSGVRVVIDLRDDSERALAAPSWQHDALRVIHVPVFENRLRDIRFNGLAELYSIMIHDHASALARAFIAVAENAGGGVLVHCTAGKDRTGVVIALVQSVVGVDRTVILDGYTRSQQLLGDDYLADLFRNIDPELLPGGAAHRAVSSPPELLSELLDGIIARHGSVEGFLTAHGVADEHFDHVREAYAIAEQVPAV